MPAHTLWDRFKVAIRGVITTLSVARTHEDRLVEVKLATDIEDLERKDQKEPTRHNKRQLALLRGQLRTHRTNEAERSLHALKQKYYEGGDKVGLLLAQKIR